MVLSTATAFALHHATGGVEAACITFMLGCALLLVLDNAFGLDVVSEPALLLGEDGLYAFRTAKMLAKLAVIIDMRQLALAVEVFEFESRQSKTLRVVVCTYHLTKGSSTAILV